MDKKTVTSLPGDLWRNRWSRYSLLVGVAGLLFFLALPVGSKYFLRQWLLDNGADTATIAKIKLNPFTGRFFLEDVNVTRNRRTVLTNSTIYLDLGIRALFDREALLERATLTHTLIEIRRYEDGSLRIGSYRLAPAGDQPVRRQGVPWVFMAQEIGLSDVLIRYDDDKLQLALQIDEATAKRFTTDPEGAAGTVELRGALNGAPLRMQLSVLRVSPELVLEGRLDCSGFPLGALAGLFGKSLTNLTGNFLADSDVSVRNGETGLVVTLKGKTGLTDVDLRLADLAVTAGNATWTGTVDFRHGRGSEPLHLAADGGMVLEGLQLSGQDAFKLAEKQLKTKGVVKVSAGDALKVDYQGSLDLGQSELQSGSLSLRGDAASWQGDAAYRGGIRELQLKGAAGAERAEVILGEKQLRVALGSLSLTGDARLNFSDGPRYTGTTSLTAAGLQLTDDTGTLAELGRIAVESLRGENGSLAADAIVSEQVNLPQSALLPVRIAFDRGEVQRPVADETLANISFAGLTLANPAVTGEQGEPLVRLAALALDKGAIQQQSMEVANLHLEEGAVLFGQGPSPAEPLITVAGADGSPVRWSKEQGTRIEKVEAKGLVIRQQKGPRPTAPEKAPAPAPKKNGGKSQGIPLRIDALVVGGDSALHYSDATLDPAFQTTLAIKSLQTDTIDLNRPEQAISYRLEGLVDKYAPLTLTGKFAPLASPFRLQQHGTLKNYSLYGISPLAVKAVGIALQSGQLDLTSEVTVTGEEVHADNELAIKNIEIARKDAARAQSLESNLPVPLEVAIDMLSDRQGVINVSVPIDGKLSDLRFGIQGIVVTALEKAMVQAIVPALAFTALGPSGALVYLGVKLGESLIDTGLPSLQFAPNRADLSAGQKAILDKVGPTLQRDMADGSTTYSICAKVVPGETDEGDSRRDTALTDEGRRQALYRLGEDRAQAVQRYLAETFKLDESRLFICNPTLNYGGSAGSVEFRK